MADPHAGDGDRDDPGIKAFLIADVRGYTLFTQQRGDEAAAKLAARFAAVAREVIEARGGALVELRGDEALAVFGSPRQAIRAAIDLQERFVDETMADPELPLPVGIGLDAGEAVPVEGGYRGGALNLAARLCSLAGPGEVLASREITHLARRTEGIRFVDRGSVHLKGIAEPVDVVRVLPEGDDPAALLSRNRPAPAIAPPHEARTRPRPRAIAAAVVALALVAGAGAVFVSRGAGEPSLRGVAANRVGVVDAASGRITDAIPATGRPGQIAVGEGADWVTIPDANAVIRVDPSSNTVADTIPVGQEPAGIAVGAGAVWVANSGSGTISEIDPKDQDRVVRTIAVGNGPFGVAVAGGAVWVSNRLDDTIDRIDPRTGSVSDPIPTGAAPADLAAGSGGVWVSESAEATVSRIDPATGRITATIHVGDGPRGLAVEPDAVWVANSLDGTVTKIDPSSSTVVETIPVGSGPDAVAAGASTLWVANRFGASLTPIDIATGRPGAVVDMGSQPVSLAIDGGDLLVPTAVGTAGHRGGTLTVVSDVIDSIDPAMDYSPAGWQMLILTNDGLVGFERVGGPDSVSLVPDLATSLPAPTDGGRSYTFQLRPGLRYSNGARVQASDFQRAFERDLEGGSPGVQYETEIVGSSACVKGRPCDLGTGIQADDAAGTITFHLSHPDPEFLDQLALPFFDAIPPGTHAARLHTKDPLPATGPYMIGRYVPNKEIDLVRNPQFHEWSAAAQPDGYPDRIVLLQNLSASTGVQMVEQGTADVLGLQPPSTAVPQLRTRYGSQLHEHPQAATMFVSLDTRLAPFDDVRVRRALNLAINRREIVRLLGGASQALLTCQLLPPNSPGYRPYCPFTVDPRANGTWRGPDLIEARRLVRDSGTAGMAVTLWASGGGGSFVPVAVAKYVVHVLRGIGYPLAKLHVVPNVNEYFRAIFKHDASIQALMQEWLADYVSASSFITSTLSCASGVSNLSRFCNPTLDTMMRAASQLQETDPAAAAKRWAAIDRAITNAAPYVDLANPVGLDFVSERVGDYQHDVQWGLLLGQLWVT